MAAAAGKERSHASFPAPVSAGMPLLCIGFGVGLAFL